MAHSVNWTRRASLDLAAIDAYLSAENSAAAKQEAGEILRKVDLLEQFPTMGSIFRRTGDAEYRAVLSGKYRIVYHLRPGEPVIDIITVRHGAQDEPELP
ncbi:MAG: type II toxin-antitoxin system RelE/ParE family toxin [Verrucomicrobia bacterium]|nr:type II toxin-antitoxin system RelE/ParE family toxin [Verrucomicrobiota bacterium]